MISRSGRLTAEVSGHVAIEAAIIFPIIILILTAVIDLVRYYSAQQQLNNAAMAIAYSMSSAPSITEVELSRYTGLLLQDEALSNYTLYYKIATYQVMPDESVASHIYVDDIPAEISCLQGDFDLELPAAAGSGFQPSQNFAAILICAAPSTGAFLNPAVTSLKPSLRQMVIAYMADLKWP